MRLVRFWNGVAVLTLLAFSDGGASPWVADNGDGTYRNPILHADYSDPDVIRVGTDFYMTASSFNAVAGLPILHLRARRRRPARMATRAALEKHIRTVRAESCLSAGDHGHQ